MGLRPQQALVGIWAVAAIAAVLMLPLRGVEAAFADRSALQTALFGCVGACDAPLDGSGKYTYCYTGSNGQWGSGTGVGCLSTSSTHGAINTWNVGRVKSMYGSECVKCSFYNPPSASRLSTRVYSSPLLTTPSTVLFSLSSQCSRMPMPSTKTSPAGTSAVSWICETVSVSFRLESTFLSPSHNSLSSSASCVSDQQCPCLQP